MSFDAFETSLEQGAPVELYEIVLGAETFRYTSSQLPLIIEPPSTIAGTYAAIPISRGTMTQAPREGGDTILEITLPGDNVFVRRYIDIVPSTPAIISIYQLHRDDPDEEAILAYRGAVGTVVFGAERREAKLQVRALTKARSRQLPRFTYQGLCNHMLYDSRCKLLESNFQFNFTVTSAEGNTVTVPGVGSVSIGSVPSGDAFEAGFVELNGEFRLVTSQGGSGNNDLTLLVPFSFDPTGDTIRCVVGCKHRLVEDCQDKFDNVVNFGGSPFVPKLNLFENGID